MGRPASDIRDRLIRAALERFSHGSVDGASLRQIATDANTSVGMISYHFGGKEGLVDALIERFYAPLVDDLRRIAADEPDPVTRLTALLRRMGNLNEDERLGGLVLFREVTMRTERVNRLLPLLVGGHVPLIMNAIQEGVDAGQFRDLPVFQVTASLVGAITFPQFIHFPTLLGFEHVDLVENTITTFLRGLYTEQM